MKRTLSLISITAALCLSVSCTKDDGIFGNKTIKGTIAEEYMDGSNALYWGNGATIGVFKGTTANEKYTLSSGSDSRNGKFKSDGGESKGNSIDGSVAVAPYNSGTSVTTSDGIATIRTSVPGTITFSEAGVYDAGVCPLVAVSDDKKCDHFSFVAPLGGVSVKLTGEVAITRVEITAKGGEIINGNLTVNADKDGVKSIDMSGGSSTTVIDCPEGIQLTQVAKDFVVFLPYGTYSEGFSVKVQSADGALNFIEVDGPKKITKARILNISRQQFVVYTDINESSQERANCYMVTSGGGYYFDATVKGNGQSGIHPTFKDQSATLSPAGAKLIWEEVSGLITGVSYENGKIYFACSGKDGNAVIGATDAEGNVIWSWNIWSTSEPADLALGEWVFMDRNLGAKSVDDHGLYFQWGRKDPFSSIVNFDSAKGEGKYHPVAGGPSDEETVKNTISYSVAHPDTYIRSSSRNNDWLLEAPQRYLWGVNFEADGLVGHATMKTIYDPCPPGYSVSTAAALAAGLSAGATNNGSYLTLFNGQLKVPASGFLYSGGYGWYNQEGFCGLWSCSTSWGNTENAFRLRGTDDAYDNYDRATGHPVRCVRISK
ncbi:MAG: hypothetical protein ACI4TJ_08610 [Candidatus Cryptobacteroides sp.]